MGKNNVLIYTEWLEDAELLGFERSGILYQNILRYQSEKELLEMDEATKIAFNPIKRCIDKDNQKYESICERNKENGKKGGRPKNPNKPNGFSENPAKPKKADNDNDNEYDNDNDIYKGYKYIVDLYNRLCPSLPRVKSLSKAREKAIKARLNHYPVNAFEELFMKAEASDFLKGANSRNWTATFDWLIKDSNMAKVIDGNYDNKPNKPANNGKSNGFTARSYDFEALEKELTKK